MAGVISWDEIEGVEVYPGIVHQSLVTTTSTITRYTYHPGCVFPVHQHPEEQVTVVHTGEIEFEVAGETITLCTGQVAVIPGGTPHGARVVAGQVVVTDNYIASANRTPLDVVA